MKVRVEGDIVVVTPSGWLVGGAETEHLVDAIRRFVDGGARRMVVDLSEVPMFNSLAVGSLLGCRQNLHDRGGRLVLSGANERLVGILRVTRMTMVFQLHESLETAVAALEQVA